MINKELIKDFLIYSFGSVITQASNIGLMLLLMYRVPAEQVGFFSLALSAILLISTVISCGMRQYFMMVFFASSRDERKKLINDIIVIYCAISSVCIASAILGYTIFDAMHFLGNINIFLYVCVAAQAVLVFFAEFFFQALMYTMRSAQVTFIKSCAALMTILLCAVSICFYQGTVLSVLACQAASSVIICCCALFYYYKHQLFNFINLQRAREVSKYIIVQSLPFMPGVLAGLLLASGNRWVLSMHAHLDDVAVYSLAEYVAPLFNLIILYPLSGAYFPRIMERFNVEDVAYVEQGNKKVMWGSMALISFCGLLAYMLFKPVANYFLPAQYRAAIPGALIIFAGNVFLMGTYFTSSLLLFKKKKYYLPLSMSIAAALNITLSYCLVPLFGIDGCFMSYVVAYVVYFGLLYVGNRVTLRACIAHVSNQEHSQGTPAYQAATLLQEEGQVLSNNKKVISNEPEDRSF